MSEKIDPLKWQEQMDFSKATIFRLPAGTANFLLASSILSTGLLLLLLYLQLFRSQPGPAWLVYLASLLFMAGAFYTFRSSLRFRDSIAVNDEGVLYISRYAKSAYLPWDEVASIGVHESQQRLVLRDATNQRKIRLEYQIEDFSKLREFVISHATAVQKPQGHGQNVFHRSWYNKCVLAVGAAFCFFPGPPLCSEHWSVCSLSRLRSCFSGARSSRPDWHSDHEALDRDHLSGMEAIRCLPRRDRHFTQGYS